MDAINRAAFLSVGMVSGYGFLGIFCIVVSFMYAPSLAALVGGVLCLGWAAALFVLGGLARTKPYDKTHLWLMLEDDVRPPAAVAQRLVSGLLVKSYRWFAKTTMLFGGVLLAMSVALTMLDFDPSPSLPEPKVREFPIPAILALPPEEGANRHRVYP